MRNLAGRLSVTAMSLYNHVANKEEILEGIIDIVFDEIEMPHSADWKEAIFERSISAREAMIRHPWATSLMMSNRSSGPSRRRHGDWVLGTLRSAGLSDEVVFHAYHGLESHLLGWTLQQLNFPYQGEELADIVQTHLRDFPVEDYPDMTEHMRKHITPDERTRNGFELPLIQLKEGTSCPWVTSYPMRTTYSPPPL